MNNTCRLCLSESSEIVEELWEGCDIINKLSVSLSHYVSLVQELPNKICYQCIMKVQDIYTFHQKVIQNESILQQKLNNICDDKTSDIKLENDAYYDVNESLKINKELLKEDKSEIKTESTEKLDKENNENSSFYTQNNSNDKDLLKVIKDFKLEKNHTVEPNYCNNDDKPLNILKENQNPGLTLLHNSKRFMCLTCFEVFPHQLELLRHYQTIELNRYNENNSEINEKENPVKYKDYKSDDGTLMYKCERCYKKYKHKTYIERHIKSHIDKRPFLCKLCGKTYQTASIIVAHGKMHTDQMYVCSYNCGYKSVHKHVVKDHEKRHRKEYKYKCESCSKGFQVRTSYDQHQNIHKGIKPFSCDICGMTFHLQKYLTTHRNNVHPQTSLRKPWVCKQCLLPCDSKNSLNLHLKEKHGVIVKVSILCDICGKVLRDKQQLKYHKRAVHLNIKPYSCGVCGKSFPKKFSLKVHEQIHSGKLYSCDVCEKKFSRKSTLQRHWQRFHVGSKFDCQKCEKSFPSKVKLTAHRKYCSENNEETSSTT